MKKVPCLAATLFLGAAFAAGVRADQPKDQTPSTSDILSLQDPDGTPYVINHPRDNRPSQADIDAGKKQAQQDAQNKDWLLRSYEEQLRNRASNQAGGGSDNLFLRLATDKNLSQVSGIPNLSPSATDTTAALRTGSSDSNKKALSLRSDPSLTSKPTAPLPSTPLLRPLITPLGAPDAAGLHNFYGSAPATPAAAPAKKNDMTRISADLDMPGQVAAKNDSLTKASLTFDTLPDETLPSKRSVHGNTSSSELPLGTNQARLQKLNDNALLVPGTVKTVTPVNTMTTLKLNLENDQTPTAKLTSPNPVRQPIASPYSILDH